MPREYHQMLLTWNYARWRPVAGVAVTVAGVLFLSAIVLVVVVVVGLAVTGQPIGAGMEEALSLESVGPVSLLALMLSIGSWIPLTWFVMRVFHRMRPRWLTSVSPGMRWKFFFLCIGVSVVALVASIIVGMLVPSSSAEMDFSGGLNEFTTSTAILAVIVLLTTPLQAAGEEYLFRGYLMQAVGSFFSPDRVSPLVVKWIAVLVTSTLFALGHGAQNFPLFFDRFMFGLIAGWLALRTGGLEAGIAMHILNNFLAFGFALALGDLGSSLNVSEASWWNIPLTLTQAGTYAVLVLLVAKRLSLRTRTNPPVRPAGPPSSGRPDPVQFGV